MMNEPEFYYYQLEEPNRGCLLALRDIILSQDENIMETRKWGMPCFCFKKKPLCYLWTDRNNNEQPYILMVDGQKLDHPLLEAGNRTKMKILRIDPEKDLPLETIKTIFNEALNLHKE